MPPDLPQQRYGGKSSFFPILPDSQLLTLLFIPHSRFGSEVIRQHTYHFSGLLCVSRQIVSLAIWSPLIEEKNPHSTCGDPPKLNYVKKYCPVGWGCRIHRLLLCRGVRPLKSVLDMMLNNPMVRVQQCWRFGEWGIPLYWRRSQVHFGLEWKHLRVK